MLSRYSEEGDELVKTSKEVQSGRYRTRDVVLIVLCTILTMTTLQYNARAFGYDAFERFVDDLEIDTQQEEINNDTQQEEINNDSQQEEINNDTRQEKINNDDQLKETDMMEEKEGPAEKHPKNLVAFAALGTPSAISTVYHNVFSHFADGNWSCVIYLYVNDEIISNEDYRMKQIASVCSFVRLPGSYWSHFLASLAPSVVRHYDIIAIVLDDLFAPNEGSHPVHVPTLLKHMQQHNLSTASPAIKGGYWESTKPSPKRPCVREVQHIETFFQLFTRDMWSCFHRYLHYSNRQGFCMDLCLNKLCPTTPTWGAVDQNMIAYHMGRQISTKAFVPADAIGNATLDTRLFRNNPENIQEEWGLCEKHHCPRDAHNLKKGCLDTITTNRKE